MIIARNIKKSGVTMVLCAILMGLYHTDLFSSDIDEKCRHYRIPSMIRSGFGTYGDQKTLDATHHLQEVKALKKAIAEQAVERAKTAQLVFAFKHNFLVPDTVKGLLPQDVQNYIPQINLYNQTLDLSRSAYETNHLLRALSHLNGFGLDLENAAHSPRLSLVRLVNESSLSPNNTPQERAMIYTRLAFALDDPSIFGMEPTDIRHLKAILFAQAAAIVEGSLKQNSFAVGTGTYYDAALSCVQLKHWAAFQEPDLSVSVRYCVDALELLKSMPEMKEDKWKAVYQKEANELYELYQAHLITYCAFDEGQPGGINALKAEAVERFVAWRREAL